MSPILVVLTLSALPCGLTEADLGRSCDEVGGGPPGRPSGLQCWWRRLDDYEREGMSNIETTWLDPLTCTYGRMVEEFTMGSLAVSVAHPSEKPPAGITLSPAIQLGLSRALVPPPEDAKNPAYALRAHMPRLKRAALGEHKKMPQLPWLPGPVPAPADSAQPVKEPPEFGKCPCYLRYDGSRFKLKREFVVGDQIISIFGNGYKDQRFAVAVTDTVRKRHRWINVGYCSGGGDFEAQVVGTRWYLPTSHYAEEHFIVLGYDTRSGQAWQVNVPGASFHELTAAGLMVAGKGPPALQPWSSFDLRK